jgi:hypothetical protein
MTQFAFALTSTVPNMFAAVVMSAPVTVVPARAAVPVGRVVPESAAQSSATRFAAVVGLRIETDTFVILKPYAGCGRIVKARSGVPGLANVVTVPPAARMDDASRLLPGAAVVSTSAIVAPSV